ncbi:TIGR04282 family arsenosugar biosynthesis glycosyltransferase [Trichlorobacter sp.]|uniref:TIGR04282 family arsenosugar biosynthesis glycosyltransferase n=1 Tax=Trichlorobacter sp. TaxID=2911007 RepID=UPI002A3690AE|nr:TIGR04282 family arsenosugar biosynthesis glycosyltransferase [Trichlorobacter sp.]MDY0384912.1 TIGR04282 family arsenosugar biosynthesis glycosyltransferase [Trichlorobacter sp.]
MTHPNSNDKLIALFVKPPVPGRVKTRLARDIGAVAACSLYCRLTEAVINQAHQSGFQLVVMYDGTSPEQLPANWVASAWRCLPQQGTDLGQRMAAAFSKLFTERTHQVVLIGSDIPGIDHNYLHLAFQMLANHDLVVGPALDGGYCLIGFNRQSFTPAVFSNIPWSTDQVLELTLTRAARASLTVGLLPTLQDIDTLADLESVEQRGGLPWKN